MPGEDWCDRKGGYCLVRTGVTGREGIVSWGLV